jgi:hypothetical protein
MLLSAFEVSTLIMLFIQILKLKKIKGKNYLKINEEYFEICYILKMNF